MDLAALDNPFWGSLTGPHAAWSQGSAQARRYAPGFTPLLGFAQADAPDFSALTPLCSVGERFYCKAWAGDAPLGWQVLLEAPALQMVWTAPLPSNPPPAHARPLGPTDQAAIEALVQATQPGPFGPRTREMGDYWGVFEEDRLIAMTGERLHLGHLREVSGVCSAPEAQGRGLARALIETVVRAQLQRRQTPFLHVMASNQRAVRLYEHMGFRTHQSLLLRVLAKT
ncbi:MAG: GNAT family N-acetyltransferase [Curvibacter sp.]|nr:MAG: GNAT family N-acetyltransferase [Curvibacter sp.]